LSSAAFDTLHHHYTHRLAAARDAHAGGMGVVGLVGNTIPRELVLAAGCFPVLVSADTVSPTPAADVYVEDVIPPETRALFELAMSGQLEFLDLLVLSRPYAHLYYYLKEVYRLGRGPRLPLLYMFDLMHCQREAVRVYNEGELSAFIQRLEHLTSQHIADPEVRSAVERTNRVRALQRQLQDRRWQRMLSGPDALQSIGAGYFMSPDTYANTLAEYLSTLEPFLELEHRARMLLLSSEPLSHLRLHTAIEAAGARVVAEDDWWGSQAPGSDISVNDSPRAAILQKYWLDTATSQITPAQAREEWFRATAVRDDVDGVVFYLPPSDRQLGWDYPRLKGWLDERGTPSLRLRIDAGHPSGVTTITAELAAWLASLHMAGSTA
jgi:benzoyl-CoA reductase/2-hydroxyglutaryl-CoA dehydratase subunit BcrC/BadD/HgdB